jgi:hypothetical protein
VRHGCSWGRSRPSCAPRVTCLGRVTESEKPFVKHTALHPVAKGVEVIYDALAPHITLVIVVDPNRKDHRKLDFVGEVCPFFPLCIDEGSFCSMPNHERGTVTATRQAPRPADGQALREQFKHLQVGGSAMSVGTHSLNGEATTAVMPCILLCRSFGGSPQPTTNPRDKVKKAEMTLCTFSLATSSPCGAAKSLSDRGTETLRREKMLWTKRQIGRERERPHFFGFQPPKKFVGSLPPAPSSSGQCFVHMQQRSKEFVRHGV